MDTKVFDKLSKVQELINRGSTDGEREAARIAFQKLVDKHGLTEEQLKEVFSSDYVFKFSNLAEEILLQQIVCFVKNIWTNELDAFKYRNEQRKIWFKNLTKLEYIQIVAMYEYFRRHMKSEYEKLVSPVIKKAVSIHRTTGKTVVNVKKERWKAQMTFIVTYLKKSNIYRKNPDTVVKTFNSASILYDVNATKNQIEGGKYNEQIMSDNRSIEYTND